MVKGKTMPSPRLCKPRSNEAVFIVFSVSYPESPERRVFQNTTLCIKNRK
jgi:hypothetical protein